MCGIFGYIGPENAVKKTLDGLKKLEYRGYDSSGIAGIKDGKIQYCKEVGKIAVLESKIKEQNFDFHTAIAQTRWATHGKPSRINAHPHLDEKQSLAVVHNGIIENHANLRSMLEDKGVTFVSDTDTEVVAHLISHFFQNDILKAVEQTIPLLKGSYAIALIHRDFPDQIITFAHEMPIAVGIGREESFISSDSNAFDGEVKEVIYLSNGEVAVIKAGSYQLFDARLSPISKPTKVFINQSQAISKGNYEHFTLKEIHEQPETLRSAMVSRCSEKYGTAIFDELNFDTSELRSVERILILACGTSWHAGYAAEYMLEDKARLPAQAEISSEYRYKNPIISKGTLVLAISQSGETADTIAAFRELKAKGVKVIAICNAYNSSLAREADSCLFLRAGPEIGVCSTKAFTSQMIVLSLFTLMLARMRHMSKDEGQLFIEAMKKLPEQVQKVLSQEEHIKKIAKKYAKYQDFFFIGRRYMYPTAMEGALKLKEISYINASAYAAGEMKHGPIALINEDCPTVAFCANKMTLDKTISNLMEVKARNGSIIAIAQEGTEGLDKIADDIIWVPETLDELAIIPSSVAAQLLAYYIAKERGEDIDKPRNLAKSVTVE
jgi:glucosamine--fructose-6-phosphate aminotransferase (isomerizing)